MGLHYSPTIRRSVVAATMQGIVVVMEREDVIGRPVGKERNKGKQQVTRGPTG